ncbi:hypothetical protein [Amedibacillus sp. YH-ame10]
MKFNFSKIQYKDLFFVVEIANPIIARSSSMYDTRKQHAQVIDIEPEFYVFACKDSNGNLDYFFGSEKVISLLKPMDDKAFVWETYISEY